jgi:hypothetical protein
MVEARVLKVLGLRRFATWIIALAVLASLVFGGGFVSTSVGASCSNSGVREGASAGLADCRAYEQVSPVDKGGFAAYPANTAPAQVSTSGEALAYQSVQAFPDSVGNTGLAAGHVSTRTADGWQTAEWTPHVPKTEVLHDTYKVDYNFSPDLSQAIFQVLDAPLAPGATTYALNLFRRDATGGYSLVNSNPPALPAEAFCSPEELGTCYFSFDVSAFAGASSNFSHVLLESNAQFTPNAPPPGVEALYENAGGEVRLVGILPDNTPATTSTAGAGSSIHFTTSAKLADGSVARALSQDGSHAVFQAPADGGLPDTAQSGQIEVYDRINHTETTEISQPAEGATPAVSTPESATFQSASVDGSRVFFTSSAELTTPSDTGAENSSETLYEYDLDTKQLTDLTVDTSPVDAVTGPMVQGVIDSSTDGSYIYFVAYGQFSEGKGVDGQPNLYMIHDGGTPVFIATLLATGGGCNFQIADSCVWSPFPAVREAYATPDGRHLAFMSSRSIPTVNFPAGYDNIDQETGQPDTQVYEYTAPSRTEGTGQLLCASCDPSGASPVGNAVIGGLVQLEENGNYSSIGSAFYRARAISENGQRVFYAAPPSFETPLNAIYEFEQSGEGSCEDARGCRNLISSPSSTEVNNFLGASADGANVYFATTSQLTPTDTDKLRDVYDVRVDGGIPTPPVASPCASACQRPASLTTSPQAESLTPGASDNLPSPPPPKKCKKNYRLSHGKCVKTKKKHKTRHSSRTKSTRNTRRPR